MRDREDVHPLGDLISDVVDGRTDTEEVFGVKSVEFCAFDGHIARDVLNQARERGVNDTIDLHGLDASGDR